MDDVHNLGRTSPSVKSRSEYEHRKKERRHTPASSQWRFHSCHHFISRSNALGLNALGPVVAVEKIFHISAAK